MKISGEFGRNTTLRSIDTCIDKLRWPTSITAKTFENNDLINMGILFLTWKKLDSRLPGPKINRKDMSGKAEHNFWICVPICKQWEPVKRREKSYGF